MSKLIFSPSLSKGGAERVAVNLFRSLDFDYLLVLDDRDIVYSVPNDKCVSLNSPTSWGFIGKVIRFYETS